MIVVRALTKGGELDKLRDMTKCATSIYYYISKVEPFALSIRTKIKGRRCNSLSYVPFSVQTPQTSESVSDQKSA